ncbi:MAG: DUF1289 domain-containing protein [Arenicella sp.]
MSSITDIVASPCIKICIMEDNVCKGCGRTIEEITQWRHLDNPQKRRVLDRVEKEWQPEGKC